MTFLPGRPYIVNAPACCGWHLGAASITNYGSILGRSILPKTFILMGAVSQDRTSSARSSNSRQLIGQECNPGAIEVGYNTAKD